MTSSPTLPTKALRMLLRCRRVVVVLAVGVSGVVSGQATDLIISEYVEGSSFNKYIEIYNGTSSSITISNYELRHFNNGSTSATYSFQLTGGTLASNTAMVYCNSSASPIIGTSTTSNVFSFNGDDALLLLNTVTGDTVDIFGRIGCDPGSSWTATGGYSTADKTLVRNANICNGVTNNPVGLCNGSSFPTLLSQWTLYSTDDVSHLGSHTMTCGPTVNFSSATDMAMENAGTASVTLTISPAPTIAQTVNVQLTNGVGCFYGSGYDYTTTPAKLPGDSITVTIPANATTASFTVNINNDILTEGNETVTFTMTSSSTGLYLGANIQQVFTIQDDDNTPTVQFTTNDTSVVEGTAGTKTYKLTFNPTTHGASSLLISVTDVGTLYGSDYTTNPIASGGVITVPFAANVPFVTFTVSVLNDVVQESTESLKLAPTGFTAGTFAINSDSLRTLKVVDDDTPQTILESGDIVVLGISPSISGCTGNAADEISFMCFKDITTGTQIMITDNGFERCYVGQWGNREGIMGMTRVGGTISAGQVITMRISNTANSAPYFVAPDNDWSTTNLHNGTSFNLSSDGDQMFFLQGGTWINGTANADNASYTGKPIFAVSTNSMYPWSAYCPSVSNSSMSGTNRSNLPLHMECFSMLIQGGDSYAKYTGPISTASQRDWILRVENTLNWHTFTNCPDYHDPGMGYDWLSAPTLPIIGGMVSGLWRGAKNTDWFDCKNWDDAKVPDAATDVTITEEATNDCTIGILGAQPAGTDGVCASLALSSASATVWNLAVVNGSALTIGGPLTINHSSGANQLKATVGLGSVLTADAVSITGNTSIGNEAAVRCDSMGSTLNVSGDLAIGTGGLLDLEGVDASNSGVLNLGGNYSNAGDESHFLDNFSLVTFNGGSDQTVDIGNAPEFFYDLKVDKPSNEVVLNGSIQIRHMLNLTQGIVLDTLVGVVQPLVTLEANATVVNTNHSSYVNGPVQKFGGADFTFPVGEAGYYRPCRLEDNTAGSTDAFTAEYFQEDPTTSISNMIAPSLDHISTRGYWDITSSDVSLNARVFLSWYPPASGEVTLGALGDLRVAHWNSINSIWDDRGNGGTTGTPGGGMIRTAAVETAFSPWTLASTTANNPLPIELLSFTAVPRNGVVELAWSTASEQDNDHFTVERSADAQYFDELLRQPGAGNSQQVLHYAATDNAPLAGHSYYRLRQTDYNGSSVVSEMVPVLLQGGADLTVLDDGGTPWLRHFFPTGSVLEIRDGTGRTVAQGIIQNSGLLALPVDGLAHGVYVLRVSDGLRVASTRFVY